MFLIAFLFSACNITYRVRNQYDGIDHVLHMPCGKVTLELIGRGNSKFVLKHRFDLDSKVVVFTDSLQIRFNGQIVLPDYDTKSKRGSNVEIDDIFDLQAYFDLKEGVFDGDTIIVYADSYIDCNKQMVSIDTLEFRFLNNFRIRGINYPDDGFDGKGTL